jgi:hypothetical protein
MPTRSQRHKSEIQGLQLPVVAILPDTAAIAAVGAVGRVVATLSTNGGTPPVVYTIANGGGMSIAINGSQIVTTVNPCATVGAKTVQITATDAWGRAKTEPVTVTVS